MDNNNDEIIDADHQKYIEDKYEKIIDNTYLKNINVQKLCLDNHYTKSCFFICHTCQHSGKYMDDSYISRKNLLKHSLTKRHISNLEVYNEWIKEQTKIKMNALSYNNLLDKCLELKS